MIVYQLHVGTYSLTRPGPYATFLDVVDKIDYLAALGVNVLQPLAIDEAGTSPSLGYNGSDYFSPDLPYVVHDRDALQGHLQRLNQLLARTGHAPLTIADIQSGPHQLKALIDICHLCGIVVVFDVVYNHAGGFFGDDAALYFWDRARNSDNNNSLYFTDRGWAGGLSFALWNRDVRQFLINASRASFSGVGKMMIDLRHEHEIDTAVRERKLVRRPPLEFDHPGRRFLSGLIDHTLGGIEPDDPRIVAIGLLADKVLFAPWERFLHRRWGTGGAVAA
jgi:hypothetical protein